MPRLRLIACLLVAFGLLGTAAASAAVPDPSLRGPFSTKKVEYDVRTNKDAGLPFTDPAEKITVGNGTAAATLLTNMRLAGDIFYPTSGTGPFPVLIFLHGNHGTCQTILAMAGSSTSVGTYGQGTCTTGTPAADAALAVDEARSYQGYDYMGDLLASQGYVVASMDVNDITAWAQNGNRPGYLGRVEAMSKTLDMMSGWSQHAGPTAIGTDLVGKLDLTRIGVMGHSRGGEGVDLFAAYNAARPATAAEAATFTLPGDPAGAVAGVPDYGPRYALKAVFSLAPVDGQGAFRPSFSGVAFATLLPLCDGDVSNLQGAPVFERNKAAISASGFPAIQFSVRGANHNYFNTVWVNDDAQLAATGDAPACGSGGSAPDRLTQAEEKRVGVSLVTTFMRRYVGGDERFDPIMRGEAIPAYACPDTTKNVTCRDIVQTAYVAPAAQRRLLLGPTAPATGTSGPLGANNAAGDSVKATGFTVAKICTPDLTGAGCPSTPDRSPAPQLQLDWNAPARLTIDLTAGRRDVSALKTLTFRAATNVAATQAMATEPTVEATLIDGTGHFATALSPAYGSTLEPALNALGGRMVLSDIRIPLSAFSGVDLTDLRSVTLGVGNTTRTGSMQLMDVSLQEPADATTTGTSGTTGSSGAPGTPGSTGATGSPGAAGGSGEAGAAGASGAAGTPGAGGQDGTAGSAGTTGRDGATGAAGTGTPGAPGQPGRDAPGIISAPATPTGLSAAVDRQLLRSVLKRGLLVRARCLTACTVRFTVSLTPAARTKLGLASPTLLSTTRTLKAGQRVNTRLHLPAAALAALRKLGRTTLTLRAVGTPTGGAPVTLTRKAVLR